MSSNELWNAQVLHALQGANDSVYSNYDSDILAQAQITVDLGTPTTRILRMWTDGTGLHISLWVDPDDPCAPWENSALPEEWGDDPEIEFVLMFSDFLEDDWQDRLKDSISKRGQGDLNPWSVPLELRVRQKHEQPQKKSTDVRNVSEELMEAVKMERERFRTASAMSVYLGKTTSRQARKDADEKLAKYLDNLAEYVRKGRIR